MQDFRIKKKRIAHIEKKNQPKPSKPNQVYREQMSLSFGNEHLTSDEEEMSRPQHQIINKIEVSPDQERAIQRTHAQLLRLQQAKITKYSLESNFEIPEEITPIRLESKPETIIPTNTSTTEKKLTREEKKKLWYQKNKKRKNLTNDHPH